MWRAISSSLALLTACQHPLARPRPASDALGFDARVREAAAEDLQCAPAQVVLVSQPNAYVYSASGCGRADLFTCVSSTTDSRCVALTTTDWLHMEVRINDLDTHTPEAVYWTWDFGGVSGDIGWAKGTYSPHPVLT